MFKFTELKKIHLEITNNCQASCPMCNRNIDSGLPNPLIKIRNWSMEEFRKVFSQEVFKQIDSFYFCGNFGDPILNDNLIEMCNYSKILSPQTHIVIHTNGGARDNSWWKRLAQNLPINHRVVFALDGLEDTHHLYRVGTEYKKVISNAKTFIDNDGIAEWVFIRFKHNQHQVEEARNLSKKIGFKYFTVKNSSRFILEPMVSVKDRQGKIKHIIEPPTDMPMKFVDKKIIENYQLIVDKSIINCKVQQEREVYIDAFGDLYPCCWLASVPYSHIEKNEAWEVRTKILSQHNSMMTKLGITNVFEKSLKDIIQSQPYQTSWYDYWHKDKLITCARTCSTNTDFAKPRDQIVI